MILGHRPARADQGQPARPLPVDAGLGPARQRRVGGQPGRCPLWAGLRRGREPDLRDDAQRPRDGLRPRRGSRADRCYRTRRRQDQVPVRRRRQPGRTHEPSGPGSVTFAYNNANQLTMAADPTVTTYYNADGTGLLLSASTSGAIPADNGSVIYSYDPAGQLTQLQNPDGSTVSYAYDADGRISTVGSSSGTIRYRYDAALANPSRSPAPTESPTPPPTTRPAALQAPGRPRATPFSPPRRLPTLPMAPRPRSPRRRPPPPTPTTPGTGLSGPAPAARPVPRATCGTATTRPEPHQHDQRRRHYRLSLQRGRRTDYLGHRLPDHDVRLQPRRRPHPGRS